MVTKKRKQRRSFTPEYKAEVVRLVAAGDRTVGQVARDLELTETSVRAWVRQSDIDSGKGPRAAGGALTTAEREELAALKREVKTLRMERDILKNHPRESSHLLDQKLRSRYTRRGPGGAAGRFLETAAIP